jgi:hypothetical protein
MAPSYQTAQEVILRDVGMALLVVVGLGMGLHATFGADLPVKPRQLSERAIDQKRPRSVEPVSHEQLFQQFLEWLRK